MKSIIQACWLMAVAKENLIGSRPSNKYSFLSKPAHFCLVSYNFLKDIQSGASIKHIAKVDIYFLFSVKNTL